MALLALAFFQVGRVANMDWSKLDGIMKLGAQKTSFVGRAHPPAADLCSHAQTDSVDAAEPACEGVRLPNSEAFRCTRLRIGG